MGSKKGSRLPPLDCFIPFPPQTFLYLEDEILNLIIFRMPLNQEFPSKELSKTIQSVTHVNEERSYWYVRTNSGDFYELFLELNIIAIGWNYISLKQINQFREEPKYREVLAGQIIIKEGDTSKPGYIINQIVDFSSNMKKGDIIIIPSESSDFFSMGELMDELPYQARVSELSALPYEKRRKVKWLKKNIPYLKLDPYLFKLKFLQKTITHLDPNETAQAVDRSIGTLFIKSNRAHFVIQVTQETGIQPFGLFSAMMDLFKLTSNMSQSLGVDFDEQKLEGKINVQSPGHIELITESVAGLIILAGITGLIIGIDFEGKILGNNLKYKTRGVIKAISDAMDSRENTKLKKVFREKIGNIELDSQDIIHILELLNGDKKTTDNS